MTSILFIAFISLFGLSSVYSNIADFDCFERVDPGPGRAYFEVYGWNAQNKTCTKFIYGGALGNRNRFEASEECLQSCHDAVLSKQLHFNPTRRYSAVNRLHEQFQIALNLEQVENGYFKLIAQPDGKLLSVVIPNGKPSIEIQDFTGEETQLWDIIPTGEKDYYRIKTRSKVFDRMDFMFLQVTNDDQTQVNLAKRDNSYLGQQWRFI
ncbi:unnamed protein product [Adineta steineri]|uniref:BPTI/Kunitz inhibitor domain-containing protein n=1 Tax=Adineta steineri TaxID=433720 RepID=A0A813N816_9BILA|nr:unnamed protein product [Adineta steineri]